MKKLSKIVTTTAILMAMSTSAIAVSAQSMDLDDSAKQNTQQVEQQVSNADNLIFKGERDNLLLQADICKMYTDILIRINDYSTMSSDLKSHIQEYNTQLDDINKVITETINDANDLDKTESENIEASQKAQYDQLIKIKNILQNMDNYLDATEN